MTLTQHTALAGIALNLAGVLILFRYGMPYHVESGGTVYFALEETDESEIKLERRYRLLGFFGLILVVIGSGLQGLAVVLS